jgi:hypothetical protein
LWHGKVLTRIVRGCFWQFCDHRRLLQRCRYVFPLLPQTFPIFGQNAPNSRNFVDETQKTLKQSAQGQRKHAFTPLTTFQARKRRMGCDLVPQCTCRLQDAFGSSATTGGLLYRCRYVFPLLPQSVDLRSNCSEQPKICR